MAITEDSGDSLDGLRILVLELVVLKITNEKMGGQNTLRPVQLRVWRERKHN